MIKLIMKKLGFLKVVGLFSGGVILIFGNLKNFLRTVRLALNREN
jgi:hypothetical protein